MKVNFKEFWMNFIKKYLEKLANSKISDEDRKVSMDGVNPSFTLRNYLLEEAIREAEKGDYSLVENLL
jgi:serine/tyrosine/threonine adenylyltransferase